MSDLVFPERVVIRAVTRSDSILELPRLLGIAFFIQTFRCRKNDYRLGPFFSDADGVVVLTRRMLELSAQATMSTGLMDFGRVEECAGTIQIRHLTAEQIATAERERRETWSRALPGEAELYGSLNTLRLLYRNAPNGRFEVGLPISDRWDGSQTLFEYEYPLSLKKAT